MPWPTPQDYNEALQNPRFSFADPELQQGRPELTPLGLPRPITGNFASVYRVACGPRDWAVRCFWREYGDMGGRYAAISRSLAVAGLPYTVGFDYLRQGIRVRGQWYPILKMEWVEGSLLNEYVDAHLQSSRDLQDLCRRWLDMLAALERAGIAHGDLQHGNVLVAGGALKLVDYDGMYVPGLAGAGSHELGHQNYQHPRRGSKDFGPHIDRFAAWVIYLSIAALAEDSSLWAQVNGGDECLLFRRTDFVQPDRSAILQALERHNDAVVRSMTARFRALLDQRLEAIPSPAAPSDAPALPERSGVRRFLPSFGGAGGRRAVYAMAVSQAGSGPPAWVSDLVIHGEAGPVQSFGPVPRSITLLAAVSLLLTVLMLAAHWLVGLPAFQALCLSLAALGVGLCGVLRSYYRDPSVRSARGRFAAERQARRQLAGTRRRVRTIESAANRAERRHGERARSVQLGQEKREAGLRRRRERLNEARDEAIEHLDAWRESIDRREKNEVSRRLRLLRDRHVERALRRHYLVTASIPQIGPIVKLRLLVGGIRSAADVRTGKLQPLDALGGPRAAAMLAWRVSVEESAKSTMPRSLDPRLRAPIKTRYDRRRGRVRRECQRLLETHRQIDAALEDCASQCRQRARHRLTRQEERYRRERRALEDAALVARREEPEEAWELLQAQRELEPYVNLTLGRWVMHVFSVHIM